MRTVEEILARMQVINDTADLTPALMDEYEALERDLANARRSEQLRMRNTAYNSPVPGQSVPVGRPPVDNGVMNAFTNYLRTGRPNNDLTISNAQTETTTGGGYLVPAEFRTKLIERMKAFGGIQAIADSINTGTGATLVWPTLDDTANSGAIAAINTAVASGGADLTFGQGTLGAYRIVASGASNTWLKVPVELVQDSAFPIQDLIARHLGTRLARAVAPFLATGTGSSQPLGLIHGLTPIQSDADTGVTYDDLVDYTHSVDPAYRQMGNCNWVFNDKTLGIVQKMQDSNGDPLWRSQLDTMSTPLPNGVLLGYPITVDQAMPDLVVDSATTIWGAFGDIREGYIVRSVADVTVVVDPLQFADAGQVGYLAWLRIDATQQNLNAYKGLTCNAGS